jgi:HlyD family secretion protein
MKNKIKLGLILAVLLLALPVATACTGGSTGGGSQQLVEVERGDLSVTVTGTGKIETSREARLAFGSAGKIDRILVKEGNEVSEGDVLASLDTSALELSLTQSQVALTQVEVALNQAQLTWQTANHNLKKTRDTEDALELALLNAQINLDIAKDSLSDAIKSYGWDEFEAVESELNLAEAYYDSVLDKLQAAASAGESIDSWELVVERAKERLETAQADYDNFIAGHGNEKITLRKRQVEAAEIAVTQAQKNLDELAEDVAMQELQVTSANQSVGYAQQSVELARESLEEAQRQLDEAAIVAPFSGIVAQVLAKEGDNIPSPSMAPTTIIYLVDPGHMELVVEMDEIDIPLVALEQEAVITLDALPDTEFRGMVAAVYPVPKEVGGVVLYDVKLAFNALEKSGIKVGMTASADIIIEKRSHVLLVPSRAVDRNDQGETIVKVMSDDKQIEERPVVVGLDDGLRTEIVSGLTEGETVVVEVKVKSTPMSLF